VNVLLAQAGSVVCAEGMEMTPVRLMTDLRIRDNLGKGESYFLAEVRGLRRLVSPETEAGAVLGLIDEPFRGTNHQEQHAATLAITEHLHGLKDGMYVLATHDRDVARTAAGHGIRCQHFAEELHDGAMTFDYRLKEGIAQTRNALRVLAKEGYPPSVVERAIRIAETERED
jgi:DNA mismatch repair ATPase MutS